MYSNIFFHKILNRPIFIAFKIQKDFHSSNHQSKIDYSSISLPSNTIIFLVTFKAIINPCLSNLLTWILFKNLQIPNHFCLGFNCPKPFELESGTIRKTFSIIIDKLITIDTNKQKIIIIMKKGIHKIIIKSK